MAKKKAGKVKTAKKKTAKAGKVEKVTSHRVTTHGANGSGSESMEVAPEKIPIGEAMRLAVEALGDVKITDDLAPQQMRELADVYEDIVKRTAVFNLKNEEAKTAKKSLESATELLIEKVRSFTHPSPLFDNVEREDDLTAMRGGGDVEELGVIHPLQDAPKWGEAGFNGAGH